MWRTLRVLVRPRPGLDAEKDEKGGPDEGCEVPDGANPPSASFGPQLLQAAWTELQAAAEAAGIAQKINNDPDLANAWYSWSTCMNQAGYKFRYLQEPQRFIENGVAAFTNQGGVRGSAKASQLLRQEVAIANQDWDCRVQNVNSVQVATREKIESSFLESNPGLVQAVKDAVGKTLGSK